MTAVLSRELVANSLPSCENWTNHTSSEWCSRICWVLRRDKLRSSDLGVSGAGMLRKGVARTRMGLFHKRTGL